MSTAPLTYPTLANFLDSMAQVEVGGPACQLDKVGVVEQMLLLLLTRWQLEDENNTGEEMTEVQADMTQLNRDMTDAERVVVMRHLVGWVGKGEGWLAEYIKRIGGKSVSLSCEGDGWLAGYMKRTEEKL